LIFKNVASRSSGTEDISDWNQDMLVVDIPDNASAVFFGVQLFGGGKVWVDKVRLEIVGPRSLDVAAPDVLRVNSPTPRSRLLDQPSNLDFENHRSPEVEMKN
jgi:hypothetical protein